MQDDSADQLHIEVPHAERPFRRLADHGERLGEEVVERPGAIEVTLVRFRALERGLLGLFRQALGEWLAMADVGAVDPETLAELPLSCRAARRRRGPTISASSSLMSATTPS